MALLEVKLPQFLLRVSMPYPINMTWRGSQQTDASTRDSEPVRPNMSVRRSSRFEQIWSDPAHEQPRSSPSSPAIAYKSSTSPRTSHTLSTFDIQDGQSVGGVPMTPTNTRTTIRRSLPPDTHHGQSDTMCFRSTCLRQSLAAGYAAVDRRQRRGHNHGSPTLIDVGRGRPRAVPTAADD